MSHEPTKIKFEGEKALTQQNAAEECDINIIVAKAKRGADISHLTIKQPMYGDFRNMPDLRGALLAVKDAEERFMTLDPKVRKRFDNDPAKLLDFLNDNKNRDEAVELGLIPKTPAVKLDESLETLKSIDRSLKASSDSKSKKRSAGDEE